MDFRQQAQQPASRPTSTPAPESSPAHAPKHEPGKIQVTGKWFRVLNLVVLLGIAILILAIALAFRGSSTGTEDKYVNTKKWQAVFLSNGQVYFGKVGTLNKDYIELNDVYYLTQSSETTTENASYSLLQLGCQQIHYPLDQMLINRNQVTFWENLSDEGQVAKKIAELKKTGVDCSKVTSQTQASDTTSTQNTTTPTTTKK